jgi:hypothetical protein
MLSQTTANKQYRAVQSAIKERAETSEDVINRDGEYTVRRSFSATDGYENFTIQKDSHFDNDPETRDEVCLEMHSSGGDDYELRGFEQYRRTTLGLFKSDRLNVGSQFRDAYKESGSAISRLIQESRPVEYSNYKFSPE